MLYDLSQAAFRHRIIKFDVIGFPFETPTIVYYMNDCRVFAVCPTPESALHTQYTLNYVDRAEQAFTEQRTRAIASLNRDRDPGELVGVIY